MNNELLDSWRRFTRSGQIGAYLTYLAVKRRRDTDAKHGENSP